MAPRAKGMPAYRVMWPKTSMIWSWVKPMLSAPRMWLRRGPSPSESGETGHGAKAAAGQVQAGAGPGRAPVVLAGDAAEFAFGVGGRRGPRATAGAHVVAAVFVAALEQAVRVFVGIVDAGRREVDAALLENLLAPGQGLDAGGGAAVPGVVDDQLHHLLRREADIKGVAQVPLELDFAVQHNQAGEGGSSRAARGSARGASRWCRTGPRPVSVPGRGRCPTRRATSRR